jgi:hypothetical protein
LAEVLVRRTGNCPGAVREGASYLQNRTGTAGLGRDRLALADRAETADPAEPAGGHRSGSGGTWGSPRDPNRSGTAWEEIRRAEFCAGRIGRRNFVGTCRRGGNTRPTKRERHESAPESRRSSLMTRRVLSRARASGSWDPNPLRARQSSWNCRIPFGPRWKLTPAAALIVDTARCRGVF